MGRKISRKHAFSIIYQTAFRDEPPHELAEFYLSETENVAPEDREFIFKLVDGVLEHMEEIDRLISDKAVGWAFDRIAKVDLAIMRLAIFEMGYLEDVPVGVAINEAVELAKTYGTDDSAPFVNGLLAQVARLCL